MKNSYLVSVMLLVMVAAIFAFISISEAVTTRNLKSQVQSIRYRVTAADILAGTVISPGVREFTLFSLTGGDQILSWVSNVTAAFSVPVNPSGNPTRVLVQSIRPKRAGVEISPCDVGYTPDLSFVNFEHRVPSCGEYMFFDEDLATDISIIVTTEDGSDISGLNGGQVDFIVTKVQ